MIPDRLQYFLDDFWNFENFTESGPMDPVFITKLLQKIYEKDGNILNKYYKYMGTSLKHIIFTYMDFKKMSKLEKTGTEQ